MNPLELEQQKADRSAQKEQDILLARVRDVAKTDAGKAFIWEILTMCGIYTTTFTGNSQGAYLEGRRSVGLEILQILEGADSSFYPNLLLRNQEK